MEVYIVTMTKIGSGVRGNYCLLNPTNTSDHSVSVVEPDRQLPVLHFRLYVFSVFKLVRLQIALWKFCRVECVADLHGHYGLGILLQENDGGGVKRQNCD